MNLYRPCHDSDGLKLSQAMCMCICEILLCVPMAVFDGVYVRLRYGLFFRWLDGSLVMPCYSYPMSVYYHLMRCRRAWMLFFPFETVRTASTP